MADPERTNPAMNLPERQLRRSLMRQLRAEQEGRSVPGYAEYLQKMEELDNMMERLSTRDAWGTVPPLDTQTHRELQEAIRQTAIAGEKYLENVRTAAKTDKSISLKRGAPAAVNSLQGMLSRDHDALRQYDPATPASLPVFLERSRTRTLILDREGDLDTMGGNQNSRIPVTIIRGDGKKYRGMFTKASYLEIGKKMDAAVEAAAAEAEKDKKPEGAKELRKLREKLQEYKKKNKLEHVDDTLLFVALVQKYTVVRNERSQRSAFDEDSFFGELGMNPKVIGIKALSTFSVGARRMIRNTADMINLGDLLLADGSRVDSRSSAMSTVAGMLSRPDLVAHAENMRFTDGSGRTMEGTIMDFSQGLDLNRDDEAFAQVNDTPFDTEASCSALKQMADLQVIDYLCGNVDRHAGNMMYFTDKDGNIVGIQGIDNDSSFGNFAKGKERVNRLSGTDDMTCITQSMARKVMETDPHMLRFSLRGRGLSEREIGYSVRRLNDLKKAIREGKEHYKDRPKIGKDGKPFDKGHLRVVSDEEFKNLRLKDLADPENTNIFTEVNDWYQKRLESVRDYDIKYDPKAREKAKEKELPSVKTEGQTYTRETLLESVKDADKLVEDGDFRIDSLTNSSHGGSEEFADMVKAAKELATLKKDLEKEQREGVRHLSAAEYEARRRRIEEAEEEARMTSQTYLAKKMSERKARSLDDLRGKNPYERARIEHAKRIFGHTDGRKPAPEITEKVLAAQDGEGMELRISGELSAEEEARMAKEQLRRLHREKGLDSPEEMKKLDGGEFNRRIEEVSKKKDVSPAAGPAGM